MQVALTVILRKTVLLVPEMAKPWKAKEKSWKSQKKRRKEGKSYKKTNNPH